MSESNEMRRMMIAASQAGAVVFRNNVAQGVVGDVDWIRTMKRVAVGPGDAVVRHARVLHAGLCKGSADLIGWASVIVTPEMVGMRHALFLAPEAKVVGGVKEDGQDNFINRVNEAGGLGGFCYSEADIVALIARRHAGAS